MELTPALTISHANFYPDTGRTDGNVGSQSKDGETLFFYDKGVYTIKFWNEQKEPMAFDVHSKSHWFLLYAVIAT